MATPRQDGRPGFLGDPPEDVRVTVTILPGRRRLSLRGQAQRMALRARKRTLILALAGVGILVSLAVMPLSGSGGTARSVRGEPAVMNLTGRGGARAFATGCSSATIPVDPPTYVREGFNRAVWCMRYAAHTRARYRFIGAPLPAFLPAARR